MNNEYLWEKTGEDAEIANLENALAAFRYREDTPPALPVAAVERKPFRLRLAIAFAAPAFAAVAIAAGLWFRYDETELIFIHQPAVQETVEKPSEIRTPAVQPAPPKQPIDRRSHGVQYASTRTPRRSQERSHARKPETVALTQEERYAYRQLMLALSISSSKLKVVQDAINGVESNETSTKQNNR